MLRPKAGWFGEKDILLAGWLGNETWGRSFCFAFSLLIIYFWSRVSNWIINSPSCEACEEGVARRAGGVDQTSNLQPQISNLTLLLKFLSVSSVVKKIISIIRKIRSQKKSSDPSATAIVSLQRIALLSALGQKSYKSIQISQIFAFFVKNICLICKDLKDFSP